MFGIENAFTETLGIQVMVGDPLAMAALPGTVRVTIDLTCAAPISGSNPIQLLEKIIADQRTLLSDVFNTSDLTTIPQVWTLCESHLGRFPLYSPADTVLDSQTRRSRATMTRV